jgi:Spy/CpxP family protein refolding chaperone
MKKVLLMLVLSTITAATMAQVQRAVKPKTVTGDTTVASSNNSMAPVKDDMQSRKEMIKALNLTREQKGKFREMQQNMKAKKEAIENDDKLSDVEKKEKLRALRKEQMTATDNILNEEQREKMKQMRKDKLQQMRGDKDAKAEIDEIIP